MNKSKIRHLLVCLAFMGCGVASAQNALPVNIIPQPVQMEQTQGVFVLPQKIVIAYDSSLSEQAKYLQDILAQSTARVAVLKEGKTKGDIVLTIDASGKMKAEGYNLSVTTKGVKIVGADVSGAFYGIQSLLQLFPAEIYSKSWERNTQWQAPCVEISDAPERPWRGMMLDVARYFYDKEFVKKYIPDSQRWVHGPVPMRSDWVATTHRTISARWWLMPRCVVWNWFPR